MDQLQKVFNYQDQQVRTVVKDNEPWFVAKDVCNVLNHSNHKVAVSRLDEDEVSKVYLTDSLGRNQKTTVVNEAGLYSLILTSNKPEAKQFKRWITHEVIPTIRKTGGYVANDDLFIQTYLPQADEQTKQLFKVTLHTMKEQSKQIETMKPKALFADAVEASESSVLVGELAKILKQNGVEIGQNKLFKWLRENGYLIRKKGESFNLPTQRSMDMGLFEIKKSTIVNGDGSIRTTRTPKVTGKGQIYFVNKFIKSQSA
ncbi:phage antirepressor Ant [Bacillus sp. FSL K6-1109]|jgi:anti-repressor protein|uniref:phage antirepressor Ant n=1 Tax=Bacillus TaxID=1386 RepID=UPI0002D7B084|nr:MULTISPECIES: phage antirepressor Ant [Bacillus]MBJ7887877.1 phage antirepressor Ant [Bacillaceae bacterium HSR45]ATI75650.1 phage antirepressor Ant [Bacillus licheniformis]EQM28617.1 antirepressor [Bacillus licheniformis CG-B52]KAA0812273.1 phage antirepressor Ant [Bacillus licheniformis]KAA0827281.1 phage antirepressor Ant [Bacillus licheniformis]